MLWFLGPDLLLIVRYRSHVTSLYLGLFVSFFLDMREREEEERRDRGRDGDKTERETQREREICCCTYSCIHSLILVCSLTGD